MQHGITAGRKKKNMTPLAFYVSYHTSLRSVLRQSLTGGERSKESSSFTTDCRTSACRSEQTLADDGRLTVASLQINSGEGTSVLFGHGTM